MGTFGFWQWAVIALIVILLFGRGKISDLMGDVAKGVRSFRKGLAEDDEAEASKPIESKATDNEANKVG